MAVNLRGLKLYERTLVPMMFVMFALGAIVIVAGFSFDQADFTAALAEQGETVPEPSPSPFKLWTFLAASANPRWHTPHVAIVASGAMASVGILGSHLAGDRPSRHDRAS